MHATLRVLRREPRFRLLLGAGFISGIGDRFNTVAVLGLLLTLTGSGLAVGVGLALRVLPRLAIGPLGGLLADRLPRKVILIATDLASAVFALSFLLVTGPEHLWIVYAGTVLLVLSSILHTPARVASLPGLVAEEHLLAANALQRSADGSVMIGGSVIGGLAAAAFGVRAAFVLNAASFLISALLTAPIRFPTPKARAARGMAALGELWIVVRRSPLLLVILLMQVVWPLGGGAVNVLLSVYGYRVFGAGDAGVGVLYGAVGVGLLLGGLLTQRFARHVRRAAIGGFVAEGVCHALVSRSPSLAIAAVFFACATIGAGVANTCTMYLVMRAVPSHVLGRFSALGSTLSSATFAGSMLLSGLLLATMPPRTLGLAAGLLIAALGVVCGAFLLGVPEARPIPQHALSSVD